MSVGAQTAVGCNKDATALKEAGNVAFQSGKHVQAVELFSEAILKDPSSALLRSNRAGAFASLGRHEEALGDAEKCVQLQPDWWKGYTRRGHAQFHLKQYAESEQSFLEALALNPGEKSVLQGLEKTRSHMAGGGPRAAGMAGGAPQGGFMPPPGAAGFQPPGAYQFPAGGQFPPGGQFPGQFPPGGQFPGAAPGQSPGAVAGQFPGAAAGQFAGAAGAQFPGQGPQGGVPPVAAAAGAAPDDFKKLSAEELRARLEAGAAKLSDEDLEAELRHSGITIPLGATRAEKVKLYCQTPEDIKAEARLKKKSKSEQRWAKLCPKAKKTDGEQLLERRKLWLEEWSTWDDVRLVKRLARLGIDGDGLARPQLLDELLQAETDNYVNRCSPARIQKFALIGVGITVILSFIGIAVSVVVGA